MILITYNKIFRPKFILKYACVLLIDKYTLNNSKKRKKKSRRKCAVSGAWRDKHICPLSQLRVGVGERETKPQTSPNQAEIPNPEVPIPNPNPNPPHPPASPP
jgi:hypothetical protein